MTASKQSRSGSAAASPGGLLLVSSDISRCAWSPFRTEASEGLRTGLTGTCRTSSAEPPTRCGDHFGGLLVFDSCGMSTAFRRQSRRRLDAGLRADSAVVLKWPAARFDWRFDGRLLADLPTAWSGWSYSSSEQLTEALELPKRIPFLRLRVGSTAFGPTSGEGAGQDPVLVHGWGQAA